MEETLARVLHALDALSRIHNNEIAPLLTRHEIDVRALKGEVQTLFNLVEMNNFVMVKAMMTGVFQQDRDTEEILKYFRELQDEYLAVVSIASFLQKMAEQNK